MRLTVSDGEDARCSEARRRVQQFQAGQAWQMAYSSSEGETARPHTFRPGVGGLIALALTNSPARWVVSTSDTHLAGWLGSELTRAIQTASAAPFGRVRARALPDVNPARLVGLPLPVRPWTSLCIHLDSAPLGMLLIGDAYLWVRDGRELLLARVHSPGDARCVFCDTGAPHEMPLAMKPALSLVLDRMRHRERWLEPRM